MDILKTRTVSAQLVKDDYVRLSEALSRRAAGAVGLAARWEPAIVALIGFVAAFGLAQLAARGLMDSFALGVAAAAVGGFWSAHRVRRLTLKRVLRADGAFLRPYRISADQEGVTLQSDVAETRLRWPAVFAIEVVSGLILVYIDRANAFAVPRSAFPDDASMNAFADEMRFLKRRASEAWAKKGRHEPA